MQLKMNFLPYFASETNIYGALKLHSPKHLKIGKGFTPGFLALPSIFAKYIFYPFMRKVDNGGEKVLGQKSEWTKVRSK